MTPKRQTGGSPALAGNGGWQVTAMFPGKGWLGDVAPKSLVYVHNVAYLHHESSKPLAGVCLWRYEDRLLRFTPLDN